MNKNIFKKLLCAAEFILIFTLPAICFPVFIDAGLSAGSSADRTVAGHRSTWESEPARDMAFWIKIEPGTNLEYGEKRYQYILEMTAPEKKMVLAEGPFDFDSNGEGVVYKNTWFFANARTIDFPTPEVFGTWEAGFDIRNRITGEQTDIKKFNFEIINSDKDRSKEANKWGKFR